MNAGTGALGCSNKSAFSIDKSIREGTGKFASAFNLGNHRDALTKGSEIRMHESIMHDWSDENCVKILKNCYKAISKTKNGKVIIVDCVLQPDGNGLFDEAGVAFDLLMMVIPGGKERTEVEWNNLLKCAGFPRYNLIQIPTTHSIIEAFPE
ncbi:hypothetical protein C5167_028905 [Papaver somniferum]|nr:hypothetical protein C5167_028905 [Papaver somniferum]